VALRSALAVVVPFALLLPLVARDLSHALFGWFGLGATSYGNFAPSLSLVGIGLVFFTVHFLSLRGFYALEENRTVFFVQCAIAAVNIVAALVLVQRTSSTHTSPALVVAYATSYLVGSAISLTVLRRRLGTLAGALPLRFVVRLLVVALASAAVAAGVAWLLHGLGEGLGTAVVRLLVVVAVDMAAYLLLARTFHLTEVTEVMDTVTRRLPTRKRG
jgi:putative peptidoglycan lipid II flippase